MRRLPAFIALVVILAGLVVGFGFQFNGSDAYPDSEAIGEEYSTHVGEKAHLWGEVVGIEDGSVVIGFEGLRLRVTAPKPGTVAVGDQVQIYGTLAPDRQFETTAYHAQSPADRTYMYGVSVLGSLLAAGAFLRRWRIDTDEWQFVPREGT
ncbi:hypothetical protein [Halobellus ordinarius]|uniref:hypothetical protein n=1 Tax=Halobellus ordinarius TaxID=3075120 RepID=UPI00288054B6|nr:hypothetical protein [Halobellus sp. ZY16]